MGKFAFQSGSRHLAGFPVFMPLYSRFIYFFFYFFFRPVELRLPSDEVTVIGTSCSWSRNSIYTFLFIYFTKVFFLVLCFAAKYSKKILDKQLH